MGQVATAEAGGEDVDIVLSTPAGDEQFIATNKDVGFGNAYNAQCWFECRRNAVNFLKQAKERPGFSSPV